MSKHIWVIKCLPGYGYVFGHHGPPQLSGVAQQSVAQAVIADDALNGEDVHISLNYG
jgi:hypothetical protein